MVLIRTASHTREFPQWLDLVKMTTQLAHRPRPPSARFVVSRTSKRCLCSLAAILDTDALTDIHPEVAEALHAQKLVIALESTITTYGMPYPAKTVGPISIFSNAQAYSH